MGFIQPFDSFSGSLILFAALFALLYMALKTLNGKPTRRLPPVGIRSLPIVGSMPFLPVLAKWPRLFSKTSQCIGPVFSLKLGTLYAVVLNSKEVIHEAFIRHSVAFSDRFSYTNKMFFNPNQYGILDKTYGAAFRKNLQLTLSILKEFGFGSGMMEHRIIAEAEELISLIKAHNGKPIYPAHLFSMAAINVVASIMFGQRLSQTDEKLNYMSKLLHKSITSKRRYIDYCPPLRFLPRFKIILKDFIQCRRDQIVFVEEGIAKSLASSEDSFTKRFVECQGLAYDHNELCHILQDLLSAGSETTATTLQWAMVMMVNNPGVQKRLQKDIDSVIPSSRSVNLDDAVNLPYVEAAILELMRIKTVLPLGLSHRTMEDTEVGGYFIPINTTVIANFDSVHKNADDWPKPEVYRPERFIDNDGGVFGRDRIIPFSLGKRSCTGEFLARQELFLFFTTLLQHFDILPPEGQDRVECEEHFTITRCPTQFEVRMIPRDK